MKIIKRILAPLLVVVVPLLLTSCLIQGMESTHPQSIETETLSVSLPSQTSSLSQSQISSVCKLLSYIMSFPLPLEIQREIAAWLLEMLLSHEYVTYQEIPTEAISTSVALSADGKTAFAGSCYNKAIFWNTTTGKQLQVLDHTDIVHSVALSTDGKTALTGSERGTVIVWDTETRQIRKVLKDQGNRLYSVALSADGKTALTESDDRTAAIVWDAETGEKLQVFEGRTGPICSLALSADGKTALTRSENGTVIVWDISTKKHKALEGYTSGIYSVALSADGKTALIGYYNGAALVLDTKTGKIRKMLTKGHTKSVNSVALSKDGKIALTGSSDKTAILWNTSEGKILKKFIVDLTVWSVAFSDNSDKIAISPANKVILLERIFSKDRWTKERK